MRWLILAASIALLPGCGSERIAPPYTEEELRGQCVRQGGWWHDDSLRGGFCEYQSQGFI